MKKQSKSLLPFCCCILGVFFLFSGLSSQQTAAEMFEKALYLEEAQGDLQKAIGIYEKILTQYPDDRAVAAKAQLHIGLCYEKLGLEEAQKAFQEVVDNYPEQSAAVKVAREKLSSMLRAKAVLDTTEKTLSMRLIWSGGEAETAGPLSPDGRSMSFIDRETRSLCIKDVASGKQTVVVRNDPSEKRHQYPINSCWSPDTKILAYSWFNKDNSVELRTIAIDGSNPRTLYNRINELALPAAWSPDGRTIAAFLIRDRHTSSNVGVISVEDGSQKVLKTFKPLIAAPMGIAFSRDGRYLLVDLPQKDGDTKRDIFAFSVDGAEEFRITEHPENDTVLGWIPGSDALLFLSSRTGTYDAWMVEIADGRAHGRPRLVKKDLGLVVPLGIRPEGSLFYSQGITMSEIFTASVDLDKGTVIEPPKIVPQPLVGGSQGPQWSPDGKRLAFSSKERTAPGTRDRVALTIRSEDTGETREVGTDLEWLMDANWAPDGRSLFVVGSDGKASGAIFQVDVRTGGTKFLVDAGPEANIQWVAPAKDGQSIFYTSFELIKKRARIMSIDLSTRETRELYRQQAPPDIAYLSISPDGKELLFRTREPDDSFVLKSVPLPGGGMPREIIKSNDIYGAFCWTPDGKRILFFKDVSTDREDKKYELNAVPLEGGDVQGMGLVVNGSPGVISLHPDGRRLAYSASRSAVEVWVMENFLPKEK